MPERSARYTVIELKQVRRVRKLSLFSASSRAFQWAGGTHPFRRSLVVAALLVMSHLGVQAAWAQPRIQNAVSSKEVYEGDSLEYQVVLTGVDDKAQPSLAGAKADFEIAGPSRSSSSRVSIFNGRRTVSNRIIFTYRLTPKRKGKIEIPAPTLDYQGKTFRGQPITIEVKGAEAQDLVKLELSVDQDRVFVSQSVKVSLTIWIKPLPAPFESEHPLEVQREPPRLSIPFVEDDEIPKGLEPGEPSANWLRRYLSQSERVPGFRINNFTSRGAFDFFGRSAVFSASEERERVADQNGVKQRYYKYRFQRVFNAVRPGNWELGPVRLRGVFGSTVQGRQLEGERVLAISNRIKIQVANAPLKDQPDNFVGLFGSFRATAAITPRQAKVGDPMMLTITLQGNERLDLAALAPDLKSDPAMAERFRVHDGTVQQVGKSRKFTYSVRPLNDQVTELPPLEFSYFDPRDGKYKATSTESIPLQIAKGSRLSGTDIVVGDSGDRVDDLIETEGGLMANMPAAMLSQDDVRPLTWVGMLASLAAGYGVILLVARQMDLRRNDESGRRVRGAERRALARLEEGEEIGQVLSGLIADVAGISEAGVTTADIERELSQWQIEEAVIVEVRELLAASDQARYGGPDAATSLAESARGTVNTLLRELKERKLLK